MLQGRGNRSFDIDNKNAKAKLNSHYLNLGPHWEEL